LLNHVFRLHLLTAKSCARRGTGPVDGHLVPDSTETATAERMTEMREAGAPYAAIAEALNAEDVRTKRGGRWHPSTVQRVLDPVAQARNRWDGRGQGAAR